MKSNSSLFLLNLYAFSWILVGAIGLYAGLPKIMQGKFDIPYLVLALPVGIGLFRQSPSARREALTILSVSLAIDFFIFLFILLGTSGKFGESVMNISSFGESEIKIRNTIFFPLSFCLLGGQILFLMNEQIRHYFIVKDNEKT